MAEVAIRWPVDTNEHGDRMLWAGSWLGGGDGEEGPVIYSGRGGEHGCYTIPDTATGVRIRRWPNEGLDAEYADVLDLNGTGEVRPDRLDFDAPQPYSRLRLRHEGREVMSDE